MKIVKVIESSDISYQSYKGSFTMLEYEIKAQKLFTLSASEKHLRIWFVPARKQSTSFQRKGS
jgi:hypothetical protein